MLTDREIRVTLNVYIEEEMLKDSDPNSHLKNWERKIESKTQRKWQKSWLLKALGSTLSWSLQRDAALGRLWWAGGGRLSAPESSSPKISSNHFPFIIFLW